MKEKLLNLKNTTSIRSVLAIIKTVSSIWLLFYILKHHGGNENVLMIVVGYIIGMTNAIDGTYFSSTYRKPELNNEHTNQ